MDIQIDTFTPATAERKANPFDGTIAEMIAHAKTLKDGARPLATFGAPDEDIDKLVRQFREAARHAGQRTRVQSTESSKGNTVVSITISPKKGKGESESSDESSGESADE